VAVKAVWASREAEVGPRRSLHRPSLSGASCTYFLEGGDDGLDWQEQGAGSFGEGFEVVLGMEQDGCLVDGVYEQGGGADVGCGGSGTLHGVFEQSPPATKDLVAFTEYTFGRYGTALHYPSADAV
jgi:hypothetical protein